MEYNINDYPEGFSPELYNIEENKIKKMKIHKGLKIREASETPNSDAFLGISSVFLLTAFVTVGYFKDVFIYMYKFSFEIIFFPVFLIVNFLALSFFCFSFYMKRKKSKFHYRLIKKEKVYEDSVVVRYIIESAWIPDKEVFDDLKWVEEFSFKKEGKALKKFFSLTLPDKERKEIL